MTTGLVAVLDEIGPLRGLPLFAAVLSAWRAVQIFQLDDGRNPLPWAVVLMLLIGLLAVISLDTELA